MYFRYKEGKDISTTYTASFIDGNEFPITIALIKAAAFETGKICGKDLSVILHDISDRNLYGTAICVLTSFFEVCGFFQVIDPAAPYHRREWNVNLNHNHFPEMKSNGKYKKAPTRSPYGRVQYNQIIRIGGREFLAASWLLEQETLREQLKATRSRLNEVSKNLRTLRKIPHYRKYLSDLRASLPRE